MSNTVNMDDFNRQQRRASRRQRRRADKVEATALSGVFSAACGITSALGISFYKYADSMKSMVPNPEAYDLGILVGGAVALASPIAAVVFSAYKSHKAKIKKVALPVAFAAFSTPVATGHHLIEKFTEGQGVSKINRFTPQSSYALTDFPDISYTAPQPRQS